VSTHAVAHERPDHTPDAEATRSRRGRVRARIGVTDREGKYANTQVVVNVHNANLDAMRRDATRCGATSRVMKDRNCGIRASKQRGSAVAHAGRDVRSVQPSTGQV